MTGHPQWPDLPYAAWSDTCDTLQLWTQIAGKVRVKLTPLINHWWNATFLVTARGLAAPAMPYEGGTFDILFDFADHRLEVKTSDGRADSLALRPMAVADFYAEFMERLRRLGIEVPIRTMPCEIENAVPFDRDRTHAHYDPVYAQKFLQALVQANRVMNEFRARFIGKASPVHFFWGSFDLAVTRFSGRTAPPPKGTTPDVAAGSWPRPIRMNAQVAASGPAMAATAARRSTSMPFRSRKVTATHVWHRRSFLQQGSRAIHSALRCSPPGKRSRRAAARVSSGNLCGRGRSREMGSQGVGTTVSRP